MWMEKTGLFKVKEKNQVSNQDSGVDGGVSVLSQDSGGGSHVPNQNLFQHQNGHQTQF